MMVGVAGKVQLGSGAAHQLGQLIVHELGKQLARRNRLIHLPNAFCLTSSVKALAVL
jgi:hypothetical protein